MSDRSQSVTDSKGKLIGEISLDEYGWSAKCYYSEMGGCCIDTRQDAIDLVKDKYWEYLYYKHVKISNGRRIYPDKGVIDRMM